MTKKFLLPLAGLATVATFAGVISAQQNSPAPQAPTPTYYQVDHAVDGDTIAIKLNDDKKEVIRLIGVDTPETKKPNSPVQCYGQEASDFTKQKVENSKVRLESDTLGNNRDRYKRLLRYVYLQDGTFLNKALIAEGYGFAYLSFNFTKKAEFSDAQTKAQQALAGLWAHCKTVFNKGKWQTNGL